MKRILLVSYHFPPESAVGGLRVAKFARLLPEFDWEPHVLTTEEHLWEQGRDDSRLAGLEHVHVERTGEFPRVLRPLGRMRSVLSRRRRTPDGDRPPVAVTESARNRQPEAPVRRLKRYVMSLVLCLPDVKKNWAIRAAFTAVRIIRLRRIDWVFTSGPPFSTHFVGLVSRIATGARWVADFRDPWMDMLPERSPDTRSSLSDLLERWMEAAVARWADRVVLTTDRMRTAMAARYPSLPPERFVCIPNSIDTDRLQLAEPPDRFDAFTITYTGSLYFDRTPEPLFRAVGQLVASGRIRPADIRIKLLGYCRFIDGVETSEVARRHGVEGMVDIVDRVPYSEAVRTMRRSHLLLMLAPLRHKLVVPAKIYDYLGSGTRILTLAEPGATADLMAETACGRCFSESEDAELGGYLAELVDDAAARNMRNDPRTFWRYDVRHLTGRLVAVMTQADAAPVESVEART
jgi:glycosyltransferase involved in cell wall biosynthesis